MTKLERKGKGKDGRENRQGKVDDQTQGRGRLRRQGGKRTANDGVVKREGMGRKAKFEAGRRMEREHERAMYQSPLILCTCVCM